MACKPFFRDEQMTESVIYSMTSPTTVGRAAQQNAMQQLLTRAQQGQGQTLLVAGEAGIGKTRLVNDLAVYAAQRGFAIVRARSYEIDGAIPCALISGLLRSMLTAKPATEILLSVGQNASELAKLAPELTALLPTASPTVMVGDADKRQLFEALFGAITFSSTPNLPVPSLIMVDDAHWSDSTSLDFLLFLARKVVVYPIFLVITYRDNEAGVPLQRLLAAINRDRLAVELTLGHLTKAQTETMVRAIFALASPLQTEFLESLYALTEGNPFFIEEILKSCVGSGEIFQRDGHWNIKLDGELHIPRTIQLTVNQRTEQLTPGAQQLLKVASVSGQRFDFALVQQVSQQDEMAVVAHLKELIAAQLAVEEAVDHFVFRHALIRHAVYVALLGRERRTLHRMVAEAIEQRSAGNTHLAEMAYHYYAASDWAKTWVYARRAGTQAQSLYAPRAVVEHLSHALEAAQHLGASSPVDTAPLYRDRGVAYETLGEFEPARIDLEQSLTHARGRGDSHAEWQSLLDLGFLWTSRDFGQARDYFQQALLVARALHDPALLAQSLNRLGNCYVNNEQPYLGRHYHAEALAIFQTLDDQAGLAATLDLLGGAAFLAGDPQQSAGYYDEAITLFRRMKEQRGLSSALTWLTFRGPLAINLLSPTATLSHSVQAAEEARQLARDIQWRAGEAFAMIALGMALGEQGNYGNAINRVEEAIKLAQEIDHRWDTVGYLALASIYLDLGIVVKAEEFLTTGLAIAAGHNIHFSLSMNAALLAAVYVAQGQSAKARATLISAFGVERAIFPSANEPAPTMAQRLYWLVRAEIALVEERAADALTIVDQLLASSGASDTTPQKRVARLLKARGEALVALERPLDAERCFHLALEAATQQGALPLVWRLHQQLGQLGKQRGDRGAASSHFEIARGLIHELAGNFSDSNRREQFLNFALSQLPPAPTLTSLRARKENMDGLTGREVEVATLIQQGKSDREIGELLSLSKRTVSTHVSNILTKLDFSTRAQIAAWAVTKGL